MNAEPDFKAAGNPANLLHRTHLSGIEFTNLTALWISMQSSIVAENDLWMGIHPSFRQSVGSYLYVPV